MYGGLFLLPHTNLTSEKDYHFCFIVYVKNSNIRQLRFLHNEKKYQATIYL